MGTQMTFGSLFAGIGGFDLGFERAGMRCLWQVEIDDYCRKVLAKHWPDVPRWDDVRTFPQPGFETPDVICGGFPCQDISSANTRDAKGLAGEKSGLWNEFARVVRQLRPAMVVVENSPRWQWWVPSVRRDLWRIGYSSLPIKLCSSQFGAPHKRTRVFVVADANRNGESLFSINEEVAELRSLSSEVWNGRVSSEASFCVDDGVPGWMARGYGNAVVPQVAEWIGRRIVESESRV